MSKSEAIRQFFKAQPYASNQEVVEGLASQGVSVNSNLVNQVRHDYKHKKVRESALVTDEQPILRVKKLADEVGGVDRLIQLAYLLKKIIGGEEVNNGSEEC